MEISHSSTEFNIYQYLTLKELFRKTTGLLNEAENWSFKTPAVDYNRGEINALTEVRKLIGEQLAIIEEAKEL